MLERAPNNSLEEDPSLRSGQAWDAARNARVVIRSGKDCADSGVYLRRLSLRPWTPVVF